MPKRDYERLDIIPFGQHLLDSGDLDPVYLALPKAIEDEDRRARWLVAYWCFYHCGVACYMSEFEGVDFWQRMIIAAVNERECRVGGRWPRGHERRHARGAQGVAMVRGLQQTYGTRPQDMVLRLKELAVGGVDFKLVADEVKTHTLFGPWIAFKVCDMLERVEGSPISFDNASVFMFKDPVKACEMLFRQRHNINVAAEVKTAFVIDPIVEYLRSEFKDTMAPPGRDRAVDLQEIETILCKWKSHMNGHYPLNNDIDEINEGLQPWCEKVGRVANDFAHFMPKRLER